MYDSTLSFSVAETYTLTSFTISGVDVVPGTSANIYIVITASNGRTFARTVPLVNASYTAWTDDSYLYSYIQTNIASLFSA